MTADELGTTLHVAAVLAMPFLAGIIVGIEIANRRPKGVYHRFGHMLGERIIELHERARFLPEGCGTVISTTMVLPNYQGRTGEIELRVKA